MLFRSNTGNNILNGKAGNDELRGGDGADRLTGGSGTDTLKGEAGNDTYVLDSLEDTIIEETGQGTDTVESAVSYTLGVNLENLILVGDQNLDAFGNALDNSLTGNSGSNVLDGDTGADSMSGGMGDDTYHTDNLGDILYENASQGTDIEIRHHDSDYLLGANVENLTLAGSVYRGNGNELANVITGNDAENNLWGREGNDSLYGFGGADQLTGDTGADYLDGGEGNDIMSGGSGDDTLVGGMGNDQLDGGAGTNQLRGGTGDDTYVYSTDAGVYEIDNSDGGTDWLLFSDDIGMDRLSFMKSSEDLVVRVDGDGARQVTVKNWFLGQEYQLTAIQPGGANGITASRINQMFPPDMPEADGITVPANLVFDASWHGTQAGEQLTGMAGKDILRGYQGDDTLFSLGGDDWILGGSGDDFLDGGTGDDKIGRAHV